MKFNPIAHASKFGAMILVLLVFGLALAGDAPFKGSSSGTYAFTSGTTAEVNSYGQATLLGPFRSHEELTVNFPYVTGPITWMTADGATVTANVNGAFQSAVSVAGTYTITGGTGRFAGATGSANFVATLIDESHVSAQFEGALTSH